METINITVKIPKLNTVKFQQFMEEHCEVVSYKVLPDTSKMHELDPVFRQIEKNVKTAQVAKGKYINDNNNKYIEK